ncbi:aldehyde dehydrogenase family protein [Nonomuraea dietziae]|uniref:aldehyde dehydrogenase family protein n=1 Tax=Nonomuraea dietziae TaxID=65515 RepID=UPI00360706A1
MVVGITGFNYPLLLAAHKIAPALAAGCPVIVKPAPATPLATLLLVEVLRSVGAVPAAAVQLVTGDVEVGRALVEDRRIGAVSFTGSAAAGHAIARNAAPTKVVLELGSNAALVVAADADLEAAADAVVRGGYYASGQACISVQRVVVEEAVRADFLDLLAARMKDVVVGDPRLPETRVAPLIDERATSRVLGWVESAVSAGARLVTGPAPAGGRVITPTVLADVPDGVEVWDEEIFGPVVCVRAVADLEEAFETVNRSRYGLHVSVFTRSLATAFAAIERLEAGGVVVNEVPGFRADNMPYGRQGLGHRPRGPALRHRGVHGDQDGDHPSLTLVMAEADGREDSFRVLWRSWRISHAERCSRARCCCPRFPARPCPPTWSSGPWRWTRRSSCWRRPCRRTSPARA